MNYRIVCESFTDEEHRQKDREDASNQGRYQVCRRLKRGGASHVMDE
jgi:hypothetical protein